MLMEFWDQLAQTHSNFAKKLHHRCLKGSKILFWIPVNVRFAKMWNSKFKMISKEYESGNVPSEAY